MEDVFESLASPTTIGVTVPGVKTRFRMLRILLDRFPYAVVYLEQDETIHVIGVAHFKKRPGFWKKRLSALP